MQKEDFTPNTQVKVTKTGAANSDSNAVAKDETFMATIRVQPEEGQALCLYEPERGAFTSSTIQKIEPKEAGLNITTRNSTYFVELAPTV